MKGFNAVVRVVAVGVLVGFAGSVAAQQPYPYKPVRYVVAFAPGDAPDILARLVGDRLSRMWGRQVLVENRVGAGGTIAGAYAAKAPPDGYTLFHCSIASNAIGAALYTNLSYDGVRDFAPVSLIGKTGNILIVHPSFSATTVGEFVAYARANPGKLSYGSGGVGGSTHLTMELFKSIARIDVVHIPYKGASPALADVIGGQIPSMVANIPTVLAAVQSGKVRALVVTGPRRVPQLSSVPTMIESGFPGFEVTAWFGLCAPAGTPSAILDKLHADLMTVLQLPDLLQRFGEIMVDPAPQSRDEFAAFMRAETTRWARVVKDAGIPSQ